MSSNRWLSKINQSAISPPVWEPLSEMHPCDLQTSMKKGCLLPDAYLDTPEHKREVIAGYYAMIAEYDAMVGEYVAAVRDAGLESTTTWVLSSDHGDMQMQHRHFYKMVAYEASTHVPLVIAGAGVARHGEQEATVTQMVDLLPTFLELAGVTLPADNDGASLVPFLATAGGGAAAAEYPAVAISQFHGENLVMSWYMVRKGEMKYVVWGTGKEHAPQLWNLTADPDENTNLALGPGGAAAVAPLDALLLKHVDYPAVSLDVAQYNLDMAHWWVANDPDWRSILNGTCVFKDPSADKCKGPPPEPGRKSGPAPGLNKDWGVEWKKHPDAFWAAWNKWFDAPAQVNPCLSDLTYNWPA